MVGSRGGAGEMELRLGVCFPSGRYELWSVVICTTVTKELPFEGEGGGGGGGGVRHVSFFLVHYSSVLV